LNRKLRHAVALAVGLCSTALLENSATAAAAAQGANVIGNTGATVRHVDYLGNGHSNKSEEAQNRTVLYVEGELSLYGDTPQYRRNAALAH